MLPTYLLFLEFSRFFSRLETETENRIILISRLETKTEDWIILVSRPRRDREFCKMISRDRDDTETRNLDREIREIETETRVSSNPVVAVKKSCLQASSLQGQFSQKSIELMNYAWSIVKKMEKNHTYCMAFDRILWFSE